MRCVIATAPKEFIRANQCGDWDFGPETILASVSLELKDKKSQLAVGIHELIEAFLCREHGISDDDVMKFDLMYEKERKAGEHGDLDEPGDDERAPYRLEHQAATFVERAVCSALGIDWDNHCKDICSGNDGSEARHE